MLGLGDLEWIIQCNKVASLSQTAQPIAVSKGNILSIKYLFCFGISNLTAQNSDVATGIRRNADFIADLSSKIPSPRDEIIDGVSPTDASWTVQAMISMNELMDWL